MRHWGSSIHHTPAHTCSTWAFVATELTLSGGGGDDPDICQELSEPPLTPKHQQQTPFAPPLDQKLSRDLPYHL